VKLRYGGLAVLILSLALGTAQPAAAQLRSQITASDIQRLQDSVSDAQREQIECSDRRLRVTRPGQRSQAREQIGIGR